MVHASLVKKHLKMVNDQIQEDKTDEFHKLISWYGQKDCEMDTLSRKDLEKIRDAVERNWQEYLKNDRIGEPRKKMAATVLGCTLGEVCRLEPDYNFSPLYAGSARERLGTITLNAQRLCLKDGIESVQRPKLSSDADIMLVPGNTSNLFEDNVIEIKRNDRFCLGRVTLGVSEQAFLETLPPCFKKLCMFGENGGFVSPILCKDVLRDSISEASVVFQPPTLLTTLREHGPAFEFKVFEVSPYKRYMMEFMADFSFSFHVPRWPECANIWSSRPRLWPPKDVVEDIVSRGYHLVPIGNEDANDDSRRDWRMSFSQAEAVLSDHIPEAARKLYLLVKTLFKEHIKGDLVDIASYHLKVSLLRYLECHDVSSWKDEDLGHIAHSFVRFFFMTLKSKHCPHFFIDEINLLCQIKDTNEYVQMLKRFEHVMNHLAYYMNKIACSDRGGFLGCFRKQNDHMYAYDVNNKSHGALEEKIRDIVMSRTDSIPVIEDGKPITIPNEKPTLPFLTGNSFVTVKHTVNRVTEILESSAVDHDTDQITNMLLDLVKEEEERRRKIRAITELNCCRLFDFIPSVTDMNQNEYVIHLNSYTRFSGYGGCRRVIKTVGRFKVYLMLMFLSILIASVTLGVKYGQAQNKEHTFPSKETQLNHSSHHVNWIDSLHHKGILLDQPANISTSNFAYNSRLNRHISSLKKIKEPNVELKVLDSYDIENPEKLNQSDTSSNHARPRPSHHQQSEQNAVVGNEEKTFIDRPGFYSHQAMEIPEMHHDDTITNVEISDENNNINSDQSQSARDTQDKNGNIISDQSQSAHGASEQLGKYEHDLDPYILSLLHPNVRHRIAKNGRYLKKAKYWMRRKTSTQGGGKLRNNPKVYDLKSWAKTLHNNNEFNGLMIPETANAENNINLLEDNKKWEQPDRKKDHDDGTVEDYSSIAQPYDVNSVGDVHVNDPFLHLHPVNGLPLRPVKLPDIDWAKLEKQDEEMKAMEETVEKLHVESINIDAPKYESDYTNEKRNGGGGVYGGRLGVAGDAEVPALEGAGGLEVAGDISAVSFGGYASAGAGGVCGVGVLGGCCVCCRRRKRRRKRNQPYGVAV